MVVHGGCRRTALINENIFKQLNEKKKEHGPVQTPWEGVILILLNLECKGQVTRIVQYSSNNWPNELVPTRMPNMT